MNEDLFFTKVGKRLREVRIKRGYTAYDIFAFTHELPKNSVIRAESGQPVSLTTLIRILNALKISPEEFFKGIK
jgi:transcriptional regulator with XRE-family HTH domain